MSVRYNPCPYEGPAHDFEPLRIESRYIYAVCRKCGGGRRR